MMQFGDGVWTAAADLKYYGLRVNTRMTVCQLSGGGLALISPIRCSEALKSAIAELGDVRAIVSPNLLHHLYLGEWIEAFPDASSYGPPGLAAKRPDLALTCELGTSFDEAFGKELRRLPIAGMPRLNESLFFHRQSGTLIVTDFCFFMPEATGLTGLFAFLTGIEKKTKCELSFRVLIKDKAAFRASLQSLWKVEIQHLSMCHHRVVSVGATEALREVLDQLKVPSDIETGGG